MKASDHDLLQTTFAAPGTLAVSEATPDLCLPNLYHYPRTTDLGFQSIIMRA